MSLSAENPNETSVLAKRLVCSKSRGGLTKKWKKSGIMPKNDLLQKPVSDIVCWSTQATQFWKSKSLQKTNKTRTSQLGAISKAKIK